MVQHVPDLPLEELDFFGEDDDDDLDEIEEIQEEVEEPAGMVQQDAVPDDREFQNYSPLSPPSEEGDVAEERLVDGFGQNIPRRFDGEVPLAPDGFVFDDGPPVMEEFGLFLPEGDVQIGDHQFFLRRMIHREPRYEPISPEGTPPHVLLDEEPEINLPVYSGNESVSNLLADGMDDLQLNVNGVPIAGKKRHISEGDRQSPSRKKFYLDKEDDDEDMMIVDVSSVDSERNRFNSHDKDDDNGAGPSMDANTFNTGMA